MKHLKELLVAKGKTQSELAQVLGRDKSAITNLLQGKRQLKAKEIPVIAEFLGVSETQVLGVEHSAAPVAATSGFEENPRIPFQGAPSPAMLQSGQLIEEQGSYYLETQAVPDQCYALEVKDRSLDLMGLLPGDVVICDPSKSAAKNDIVVVQVYEDDGTATTVLREYNAPFLSSHSSLEGYDRLHEERANVAILAPVIRAFRIY